MNDRYKIDIYLSMSMVADRESAASVHYNGDGDGDVIQGTGSPRNVKMTLDMDIRHCIR